MRIIKVMKYYISALVVGVVAGILSAHSLFAHSWTAILFWGAVGVVLGFFTKGRKDVIRSGIVYGVFLTLSFLLGGFQGALDKFAGFALFSILLCIPGALGGIIAVFIGNRLTRNKTA